MRKTTFTLSEAAELLSCHPETLRRSIKDGVLCAARLGREYRISRSDLQAFWTARGGGELFHQQEAESPKIIENQSAMPIAAVPTIQTNGPQQLSLLTPGGR